VKIDSCFVKMLFAVLWTVLPSVYVARTFETRIESFYIFRHAFSDICGNYVLVQKLAWRIEALKLKPLA
jgi:hypothetical protein